MKRSIILNLSLAALLSLSAFGQHAPAKQAPPAGAPPKPFAVPAKQRFTLPNGMRVTLVPYGSIPKVTVVAAIRAGGLNEAANQVSLSEITAELLKEGTTSRTAEQIATEAASMGGALEASSGADQSRVEIDVLSEFGPKAVALIADVVQHPLLPAEDFDRIRKDQVRQVAIDRTRPGTLATERFRKVLYGDHPYSRVLPTEAMLNGLTLGDAKKFYDQNYGAGRTDLYVGGRFDVAAVKSAITAAFKDWKKGPDPLIDPPKITGKRSLDFIDKPGAPQSTVYIGLPTLDPSNPDYIPMLVTNTLLGGSFGSRITANIREQKGYTYSPNGQVSVRYRDGYWVEVADVTTAVTGLAIKEIFGEVSRLRDEPPSKAELDGIKNYMAGVFVLRNSSRQGLINQLAFVDLHQLGDDYLTNYVQKVYAVTPEQVSATAKKYLNPDKMAIVVVGDPEKAKAQLADYQAK
jgi:zinc protease